MSNRRWMILCLPRNLWWRPRSAGYTEKVEEAGRYTDAEALDIAERMNDGGDRPVKLVPVYLDVTNQTR